jgi:hypothetical protein
MAGRDEQRRMMVIFRKASDIIIDFDEIPF